MKKILDSIYSDGTSFYVSNPYPRKNEKIMIKLRMIKNDVVKKVFIRYKKLGMEIVEPMKLDYEKNGLSYFVASVVCVEDKLSYQFYITTEDKIYFYTQYRVSDYLPDESQNFQILVDYDAPVWMRKSVFYQIMVDRFFNGKSEITPNENSYTYQGHRPMIERWGAIPKEYEESHCMDFYGGDLYGVIEKLDYLQDLGVNALYLNPIFISPTMHKYDALDYFEVDPHFGGNETLIELSKELKKRDMRLMLDISVNHTSSASKWFNKDLEFYDANVGAFHNKDSKERQYYFIEDDGKYHCWAGVETMPTLNYGSKKLRDIIYKNADSVLKKWLKPPYDIDGWRFDVADVMARNEKINVYEEVWEEINHELKTTKLDSVILAEEWMDASEMYGKSKWDSTMNYFSSARPIREFAGEGDLFINRNPYLANIKYETSAENLNERILQFARKNPSQIQYQMLNLIDSHDVSRLHNNPEIDFDIYKGAVVTLLGLPGATSIYYGDEKYLDGRINSNEGARYPMDWSEKLPKQNQEIFDLYRKLMRLKSSDVALQEGGFDIVYAKNQVFAYVRFTEDKLYLFVWSKSENKERFELDLDKYGMQTKTPKILTGNILCTQEKYKLIIEVDKRSHGVVEL
ncbi:MAG: glycoside hydrolase family 13 protein [Tissierellia bacterium]|nr:glycoside hydrolase family 13 protein [Tissierellia bacterium]